MLLLHRGIWYVCASEHVMAYVWKSEDNMVEWVLPFHLYVDLGDWTQVSSRVQQVILPAKPP